MKKKYVFLTAFIILINIINAKTQTRQENPLKKSWTNYFGADSTLSIRTIGLIQLQCRYLQLNPNSISPSGETKNATTDIAMTRVCIGHFFNYKKLNMLYLLGNNAFSIANAKQGNFYTYEAYISYNFIPQYFTAGIGQTLYNGISRASSLSISQFMTVDYNHLALPTAGKSDNIGRQFQFFAIGKIKKLEYRAALVRPMLQVGNNGAYTPTLNATTPKLTSYDFPSDRFGHEAYIAWQFLDLEDIKYSSKSFSYLGAKKIFNIGAGYEFQPRASAYLNENMDTIFSNTLTIAADMYADIPLKSGAVFSSYAAFYKYEYGKNYIKIAGSMNYFAGGNTPQGAGNNEFIIGTGQAAYCHLAYLFAKNITKEAHRLQIYAYVYYKDFQALNQKSFQPGAGINYYLLGQNAKIAIQYYRRNIYNNQLIISETKNNISAQFQISF